MGPCGTPSRIGCLVQKCSGWGQGVRELDLRLRGRSTEECPGSPATRQDLFLRTINLLQSSWGVDSRTRLACFPSRSHLLAVRDGEATWGWYSEGEKTMKDGNASRPPLRFPLEILFIDSYRRVWACFINPYLEIYCWRAFMEVQ